MALQQDTKNKHAVLSFGRMNPPTTGHEAMIKKTHAIAKQHGGTAHVVASHKQHKDTDPLPQDKKLGYIRKIAHPDVKVSGSSNEHPTIMHAAAKLHAAGHTHLHVVSDKSKEFHNTLHKYNNKKSSHGHYNFKSITVHDSGKRDSKASGVTGMSGTKMRHYSKSGQHDKFKAGLPKALHPHAKEIHGHIGGTQLESFKEAMAMKKKFKPSGAKTKVIVHAMPEPDRSDKTYGLKSSGKGAPANTTRAGGTRFGEGRYMRMVNAEFEHIVGGDQLDEILSRQGRIKRALMLRRFKHKIQRRRKMMRKKVATKEMLHRRSRRHAVKLVRKRFMGKKGEMYNKLGIADKILIDKKLATKRSIIDRIAKRLLPKVRRAELVRLRDMKNPKTKKAPSKAFKSAKASSPTQASGSKGGASWGKSTKPLSTFTTPTTLGAKKPGMVGTSSYAMPQRVKSEGYVGEENIIEIVDMIHMLSEKDMKALDKKINESDIDSNILFEVFAMGLDGDGPQTPQQQGFMSLNTFIADDYNTAAALEVPDKKYKPEEAITNLALNTRNRNSTIKNYNYGPLNDNDEEYWEKVADLWDTNTKVAKESRCHNCAAFDVKPATLKKIAKVLGPDGDAIVKTANIGYCEMFAFKCAGARVCDAWVGGGPLKESAQLYEAISNWNDNPITGVQLDRRYNRPMVAKSTLPRLKEFKATGEDSSVEDPVNPRTVKHDIIDKKKRKKNGKIESLSHPHDTDKAYRRDTPGQNEEKNCGCGQNPCITYGKQKNEDINAMFEDAMGAAVDAIKKSPSDDVYKKKASEYRAKELEKVRNKRLQDKMLQQIAVKKRHLAQRATAQSRGSLPEDTNEKFADFLNELNKRETQAVNYVRKSEADQKARIKKVTDRILNKPAQPQGKSFHQNRRDLANKGIKSKPIDKNKFFKSKTKVGGVQNESDMAARNAAFALKKKRDHEYEMKHGRKKDKKTAGDIASSWGITATEDAAAMMRVKQAQTNQKDRLRQQFEREMEDMDNSEEKKKKREAFQKSMQTLKDRQMARQDQARARLPR